MFQIENPSCNVLGNFVKPRKLGIVSGEAGMMRLFPGLVRIPDAAFARRERFPEGRVPREPVARARSSRRDVERRKHVAGDVA